MPNLHPPNGRSLGFNVILNGLAVHPIPFRFLSLIALVSGIASHMTSDVSSQSHRSASSNPPITIPPQHHFHHHHHQLHQQQQQQQQYLQQYHHQDHHRSHGLASTRSRQHIIEATAAAASTPPSPRANVLESQIAEGQRPPPIHSDSILDMIDREQVGRILARKRAEEEDEKKRTGTLTGVKRARRVQTNGEKRGHGVNRVGEEGEDEAAAERKSRVGGGGGAGRFGWIKGIRMEGTNEEERRKGDGKRGGGGHGDGHGGRSDSSIFRRTRNKKPTAAGKPEAGPHNKERNSRHRVSLTQLSKRINDSSLMTFPIPNPPIPDSPDPFPPLEHESDDKILKSSKDALVVTKREYLRRDWCRTEPLVQRVKVDGCMSRSLVNGFCYGQCNSFYIPRSPNEPSSLTTKPLNVPGYSMHPSITSTSSIPILYTPAFKSCAFCKPKEISWTTLTLRCPALKPAQLTLRRRVERIKQCKCITEVFN